MGTLEPTCWALSEEVRADSCHRIRSKPDFGQATRPGVSWGVGDAGPHRPTVDAVLEVGDLSSAGARHQEQNGGDRRSVIGNGAVTQPTLPAEARERDKGSAAAVGSGHRRTPAFVRIVRAVGAVELNAEGVDEGSLETHGDSGAERR